MPPKPGNAFAQQKEMERLQKIVDRRVIEQRKVSEAADLASKKSKQAQQAYMHKREPSLKFEPIHYSESSDGQRETVPLMLAPTIYEPDPPTTPQTTWSFGVTPTFNHDDFDTTPKASRTATESIEANENVGNRTNYSSTDSSKLSDHSSAIPNALFYDKDSDRKNPTIRRWQTKPAGVKKHVQNESSAQSAREGGNNKDSSAITSKNTANIVQTINQSSLPLAAQAYPTRAEKAAGLTRIPLPQHIVSNTKTKVRAQQPFLYDPSVPKSVQIPGQPIDIYSKSPLHGITSPLRSTFEIPPPHSLVNYRRSQPSDISTTPTHSPPAQTSNEAMIFANSAILPTISGSYAYTNTPSQIRPTTVRSMAALLDSASDTNAGSSGSPLRATIRSPLADFFQPDANLNLSSPSLPRSASLPSLRVANARITNVSSLNSLATIEQVNEKIEQLLKNQAEDRKVLAEVLAVLQGLVEKKEGDEILFDKERAVRDWYDRGGRVFPE